MRARGRRVDLAPLESVRNLVAYGDTVVSFPLFRGALFAQALALQFKAVRVVDQAVEDGIGDGRIADLSVQLATGNWLVSKVEQA